MDRFSYSFSFIPRVNLAGTFMFYLTVNEWAGSKCLSSKTILELQVTGVEETKEFPKTPAFAVGMVDLAYTIIAKHLGEMTAVANSSPNAHVYGASHDVTQKM